MLARLAALEQKAEALASKLEVTKKIINKLNKNLKELSVKEPAKEG